MTSKIKPPFISNPPSWKSSDKKDKKEEILPLRFCLYARKSSESDERQAMSIDSQIKEMLEYAKRENIEVLEILRESHSAKESRQRPVFNQLLIDIRAGKFNGILAWATDRLSRNAGDLGSLVDLMDDKLLIEVRTYNQKFINSPNEKFLLMILGSQAKLENDNRGVNSMRGMRAKCEMGHRPTHAPLGFLHDRANRTVKIDSKRAPIIKEMFEKVAYHGFTGRAISRWLDEIGFKTRQGKKVGYSIVYSMLNNPYYCGIFEFPVGSGSWYKTKHKPIIAREVFDEVQRRLVIHPKLWPNTKEFDYTKLLKCGCCGSGITASEKLKKYNNGTQRRYVYYHCTQFRDQKCQNPYIREEALIEQLEDLFEQIPIEMIAADEKIKFEIAKFVEFGESVLRFHRSMNTEIPEDMTKIDARSFAKYVLKYGNREEKRNLLTCLNTDIFLKDQKIYVELPDN